MTLETLKIIDTIFLVIITIGFVYLWLDLFIKIKECKKEIEQIKTLTDHNFKTILKRIDC